MSNSPNPFEAPKATLATQQTSFFGHPLGLMILFIVEMWERFSYYGMRALLVLYLTTSMTPNVPAPAQPDNQKNVAEQKTTVFHPGRGWTKAESSTLYGWYTGIAYLLPLIGGFIADRWIGNNRSLMVGGIIIALGHIVLAISGMGEFETSSQGMSLFIAGLVLIVIGTGHFKPCVSSLVGQLYSAGDPRRDGAYTIFYMGINLGAALGAIICGYLAEWYGWHWGFGAAAVGMIAGLIFYQLTREQYLGRVGFPEREPSLLLQWIWIPLSLLVAVGIYFLNQQGGFTWISTTLSDLQTNNPVLINSIAAIATSIVLGLSIWFILIQEPEDQKPVATIFAFVVFNGFFWLAFEQAGSSMNIYTQDKVDRVLFGMEIPAAAFQSVNAIMIVMLGPIMNWLWSTLSAKNKNPSQAYKMAMGLVLLGLGFAVLVISCQGLGPGIKTGMGALILCYFLHTLGELFISPTGLSYVNKNAPIRFLSLLTGIYFTSNFLSNLTAGLLAAQTEKFEKGEVALPWSLSNGDANFFAIFVVSSLGCAVLVLLLSPWLIRWARK
jgi:POT family proton-dependent oligopeptide transporter